jgi:hypothetical protein
MTDDTPGPAFTLRSRTIGHVHPDDDTLIVVEHVYAAEGTAGSCSDCGKPAHDPGMVGLVVHQEDDEPVSVLMLAEDALVLAGRLTRAANLIFESQEDVPDIARDMARFAPAEGVADDA